MVIATGIFPPDIGGPATHSADLSRALRDRGHRVVVLSLTDGSHTERADDVVRHPRRWPWPLRTAAAALWLVRHRLDYDAVYATGLDLPAVAGARLARRPVALKIPGDRAWERGRRLGLTQVGFDAFQHDGGGPARLRAMRAIRNWAVRHASVIVAPSQYLAGVAEAWTAGRTPVTVVLNGVRPPDPDVPGPHPDDVGEDVVGLRLVFVGRLVSHKRVDLLLDALDASDPSITLEVVGDGPERGALEAHSARLGLGSRVRFAGVLDHDDVLRALAGAHALVSASAYEGLPHVVIEALVCGTPVVTTPAGGVVEVIVDDANGILVEPADPAAFAAVFDRLRTDPGLRARLAAGALDSGATWGFDRCATQIVDLLASISTPRPRAVYLGRGAVSWPPGDAQRRKLAIHARHFRQLSIGSGPPGLRSIAGVRALFLPRLPSRVAGAALYYLVAPVLGVAAAVDLRPRRRRAGSVVVCQSPYEGLGAVVARTVVPRSLRPLVQIELHGDWRTASRMYGSKARRLVAPAADRVATWALQRADRVRAVSVVLEDLARSVGYEGPIDRHITYSEFDVFFATPPAPPPDRPVAAFVGVLERYKAVDVLLDSWPAVVARVPTAELVMVGAGTMRDELHRRLEVEEIPSVRTLDPMPQTDLSDLLDRSTCLVLPSRSEGLPRIVLEAMARGRAVVASDVGGMRELVDASTGRIVGAEDVLALTDALVEVLGNATLARAMGQAARERADRRQPAAEYEAGIARLAAWVRTGRDGPDGEPTS